MDKKPEQVETVEGGDLGYGLEEPDQNPEVKAWFEKHPTEEEALTLPIEEKKDFILKYYSEDVDSEALMEKMFEEAEKILDKELKEGRGKSPFSEAVVYSVLAIAKAKIMDELLQEVERMYAERRKLVKGKDIKDPGVIRLTQINCNKLAENIQRKILQQAEQEAKSHEFALGEFMYYCYVVAANDYQTFVEVERLYNHRKTEENKNKDFDKVKVKEYIEESLRISEQILKGELDSTMVFMHPQLLSDRLYNLTGFESEEVVYYIRKMVKDNTIEPELVDLIVKEAYSVEKSKENCHRTFDNHMMNYEKQVMEEYVRRAKAAESIKDPLEDPAVKKMIETGLLNRKDAEDIIKHHGAISEMTGRQGMQGGMPQHMFAPGMIPAAYFMQPPREGPKTTVAEGGSTGTEQKETTA